jgi:hypothetical protein
MQKPASPLVLDAEGQWILKEANRIALSGDGQPSELLLTRAAEWATRLDDPGVLWHLMQVAPQPLVLDTMLRQVQAKLLDRHFIRRVAQRSPSPHIVGLVSGRFISAAQCELFAERLLEEVHAAMSPSGERRETLPRVMPGLRALEARGVTPDPAELEVYGEWAVREDADRHRIRRGAPLSNRQLLMAYELLLFRTVPERLRPALWRAVEARLKDLSPVFNDASGLGQPGRNPTDEILGQEDVPPQLLRTAVATLSHPAVDLSLIEHEGAMSDPEVRRAIRERGFVIALMRLCDSPLVQGEEVRETFRRLYERTGAEALPQLDAVARKGALTQDFLAELLSSGDAELRLHAIALMGRSTPAEPPSPAQPNATPDAPRSIRR